MNGLYRKTKTVVSMVNYYFVFCPLYRRKIFLIDGLEARFRELTVQICEQNDFNILTLDCYPAYVCLSVSVPPDVSPADVMRFIKMGTTTVLRNEFSHVIKTRSLWTRGYFVSTDAHVSDAVIQRYVSDQKTRE